MISRGISLKRAITCVRNVKEACPLFGRLKKLFHDARGVQVPLVKAYWHDACGLDRTDKMLKLERKLRHADEDIERVAQDGNFTQLLWMRELGYEWTQATLCTALKLPA